VVLAQPIYLICNIDLIDSIKQLYKWQIIKETLIYQSFCGAGTHRHY